VRACGDRTHDLGKPWLPNLSQTGRVILGIAPAGLAAEGRVLKKTAGTVAPAIAPPGLDPEALAECRRTRPK
jgi:hypothetical protein